MRFQSLAALLVLAGPAISAPAPGGKDSDCSKTVKAGQSIQNAINNAKSGDTITIEAGTYREQLEITKSDITIVGKKGAVLLAPQTYTTNFCSGLNYDFFGVPTEAGICIHGKGIVLDVFKGEHKKVLSVQEYIKNVVVTGLEVRNFTGFNIVLYAGKDSKFTNNKLVDGGQYGFLTHYSKNTLAEGNVVTSTTAFPNFIALCMDDQSDARFKGNDISNYIIALCTQTPGGLVKSNTVKNCCVGPFVDPKVNGARIIENIITNRNPACPANSGAGIVLLGALNTLVEKNTIQYINNNGTGTGIYLSDDDESGTKVAGNIIKKNYFKNNDVDIFNNATIKPDTNVFERNSCSLAFVNTATGPAPAPYCGGA